MNDWDDWLSQATDHATEAKRHMVHDIGRMQALMANYYATRAVCAALEAVLDRLGRPLDVQATADD